MSGAPSPALRPIALGHKTLVMGIVNVTPDSFFDGGKYVQPDAAVTHARRLIDEGADMLDVGGESSRPGAEPVAPEEEQRRVLPVIEALVPLGVAVSVDTCHAQTAARAFALGAAMLNDITALRGDADMARVVAEAGRPCVLMHMRGDPRTMQEKPAYDDVVDDVRAFFEERLAFAFRAGIPEERLWLDPGFGFGKTVAHNLEMLRRLREFKGLGRPLLIGTSNKSTIGNVLDVPVDERGEGTAATVAIAIWNGADAVRVHDVRAMARVARMTDSIMGRGSHG